MLFEVDGIRAERLDGGDAEELQKLMERCSDFWQLVRGEPPPPDQADEVLRALPEGKTADDKLVLGFYDRGGLIAAADLIVGLRRPDDWCLGLFVLEPERRRRGLGRSLFLALAGWAAGLGARSMCLVVQTQNARALRFWGARGFRVYETGRQSVGPLESDIVKMELALPEPPT